MRKQSRSIINFVAPLLSIVALMIFQVISWARPTPADAEPYHRRVLSVAQALNVSQIGEWVGQDVEVPMQAQALLKPNVLISKRYYNQDRERVVNVLFVQCKDSRDLAGHYPKNCYPANGWRLSLEQTRDWDIGGKILQGMEYEFDMMRDHLRTDHLLVDNILMMPGTEFPRDMVQFNRWSQSYERRYLGGGQIQVVFWGEWPQELHERVYEQFVQAYLPLIEAIRSGSGQ